MNYLTEEIGEAHTIACMTPRGDPDLAERLNNVSAKFSQRYDQSGKADDLGDAIHLLQEAVDISSGDHQCLANMLNEQAMLLQS
jgi:hypothetical protein